MIRPDVATMIVTATTDAVVEPAVLAELLQGAAGASLNHVSVDGSESTNDTLVALASGASGVTASGTDADALGRALTSALLDVARQMVADGEGASRFAHYTVTGAADGFEARTAVRAIGEDILVRCALHGADPNWGRMLARAGTCGVALDPERIAVWVGPAQLVAGGVEVAGARSGAIAALREREVEIRIDLAAGDGSAELYASSLSPEYVTFNAEYTT
jgi:glutamate N-acetyltransferase/amino-acid N-acetyltransferase